MPGRSLTAACTTCRFLKRFFRGSREGRGVFGRGLDGDHAATGGRGGEREGAQGALRSSTVCPGLIMESMSSSGLFSKITPSAKCLETAFVRLGVDDDIELNAFGHAHMMARGRASRTGILLRHRLLHESSACDR